MDVVSACALRAGSIAWRSGPDTWSLTVVCKATYALAPGASPLAREQDELDQGAGDLAPFKARAEVRVIGHAFAPHARPVSSLVARVIAGGADQSIELFSDRVGAIRMPIRWEHQVEAIRSHEQIVLDHLHPEHARLVTSLEAVTPRATIERSGRTGEALTLRCDTLVIDTDRSRCALIWRAHLQLWHAAEPGRVVITIEPELRQADDETAPTIALRRDRAPSSGDDDWSDRTMRTVLPAIDTRPVLPFVAASAASLATVRPLVVLGRGSLARAPGAPVIEEQTLDDAAGLRVDPPEIRDDPTIDLLPPAPLPLPPPPPMIGPLAGVEIAIAAPALEPEPTIAPVQEAVAETLPVPDPAFEPPQPEPPPIELTIEQLSAIEAEIAEKRASREEILRAHQLTEAAWIANETRWAKAIEDEAASGSSRVRGAGDQAYLAAVEGFRGPITLAEYARIVIAIERGRASHVLDELAIQRPALMRIVRLWTRKVARDARLADEARALLSGMRAS